MNNRGLRVGGIDQAGHGESDGATALVTDIREWTSNTIQFMDLCVRGKYKNKQFTKFFFYGHSWGASSYMAMIFLEGKLLAKYNVLGIIMSAPYFFMEDSQFNELAFNPILNSFTPILVYGCLKYEWGQILGHLLRANVLPIWQATLANGGYRLGAMDFFAYLQTVVNTSRIIINTPDQDTKQILAELPNLHIGFIQTNGDGLQNPKGYMYVRDKFQRNMSPQKFTFFDWTTRPHSYFCIKRQ